MTTPDPGAEPPRPRVLDRSLDLVEFLRARCPWDAAQTADSLRRHLLEEAHEVVHAISEDRDALPAELGDLLFNVAFQIVVGEEDGRFDRDEVVTALETKIRRRHPRIYGDGPDRSWSDSKREEAGSASRHADEVPPEPDPLHWADRVQRTAAEVGFDWPDPAGALDKVGEELAEVTEVLDDRAKLEDELGDLLFSAVNVARLSGVAPGVALVRATRKFQSRFRRMRGLADDGQLELSGMSMPQMERLWQAAKVDPDDPSPPPSE